MSTVSEVREYIEGTYVVDQDSSECVKASFYDLAENSKIQSRVECYDYDKIKRKIIGDKCASADALYLKRFIYFIEFKTGFATEKTDANTRTHIENLQLRIKIKAYESLGLFEKVILPEIGDGKLNAKIQKHYIAVIDSMESPMDAYSDILAEASGKRTITNKEELKSLYMNSLLNYRRSTKTEQFIFYNYVDVWYDFEFDEKILKVS